MVFMFPPANLDSPSLPGQPPLSTGVDTITGVGIDAVLVHVQVVVDLANSPSFADEAVLGFFQTSGRNLLDSEVDAGVRHHVALTIVGAEPGFQTTDTCARSSSRTADQRGSAVHDRALNDGIIEIAAWPPSFSLT
jgi:hypothetical protein